MNRRCSRALRDEQGQALVFVVLAAGALIAVLALVVDVGGWFQAQRRAQSVADAAVVAAAPQLIDDPAGVPATVDAVADQNWSGARVTKNQTATAITVVARPPVNGVLSPFGNILTPDISASATARIQVPAAIGAVAPIVVVCSGWCDASTRWSTDLWVGRAVPFTYFPANPGGSSFAPAALPGATTRNFASLVACDATAPSSGGCNTNSATAPRSYGRLCLRTRPLGCRDAVQVGNALSRAADGTAHLVAIANRNSGGSFDVVGWGVGTFTNVSRTAQQRVDLEVTFLDHPLLVDGKWVDTGPSGAGDFGIRAIALTG
jgi:Flp pilus assembly protein TadG